MTNPNKEADAPVIRQIMFVFLGFAIMTALLATTINLII